MNHNVWRNGGYRMLKCLLVKEDQNQRNLKSEKLEVCKNIIDLFKYDTIVYAILYKIIHEQVSVWDNVPNVQNI
jgi:hypothetical protein